VLVDDMIDTAGTIVRRGGGADGARRRSGSSPAPRTRCCRARPRAARRRPIERVVVTNTLPLPPEGHLDKIEVCSIAPIVARR
jgi:ribose-phosphate pyrophosphokinase